MFASKTTLSTFLFTLVLMFLFPTNALSNLPPFNSTLFFLDNPPQPVEPKKEITQKEVEKQLAKAITKIYRHISFKEALKVVKATYKYADLNKVSPTLALGIIASESSFRKNVVSHKGATGYTQVMPEVHRDKIKGRDITDTHVNIQIGMRILGDCFKKKGTVSGAFGCYYGSKNPTKIARYESKVEKNQHRILSTANILA